MGTHSEKAACIGGPVASAASVNATRRFASGDLGCALAPAPADPQKKSTVGSRFVSIRPVGCVIQWAQGLTATPPTITSNALSTWASPNAAAGPTLLDGEEKQFVADPAALSIGWAVVSGSGFVELYVAETQGRP
jgi:hypothetical protein